MLIFNVLLLADLKVFKIYVFYLERSSQVSSVEDSFRMCLPIVKIVNFCKVWFVLSEIFLAFPLTFAEF